LIRSLPFRETRTSSRLANTPRYLYFPGGEKFETEDNGAVDKVRARFRCTSVFALIYHLESRKPYVIIALLALILFLWGGIKYGVPLLAKVIAYRLPSSALQLAGEQTLEMLDKGILKPSELEPTTQNRLRKHFQPIIAAHPDYPLNIVFRKGGDIGPNAFALPDGTILFTDEMVQIAEQDDELSTVLTHEIGHVIHRHGMRLLIQDSILGFTFLAVAGDVSGSSELFLGMPVLLTEMAYSREFEREADRYALTVLRAHDIPIVHFADLMGRIENAQLSKGRSDGKKWSRYLSSHPLTADRIKQFESEDGGAVDK
jgi:Zn-dependent protease with chaperone function